MFKKDCIKVGMIVKFHSGEFAIASYENRNSENIILCWNNNSGKCLNLEYYLNDLTYPNHNELDIDEVYDLGSYWEPFDMNVSIRALLWSRQNKNKFSSCEKTTANGLKCVLSTFREFKDEIPISCIPRDKIIIGDDEVNIIIPEKFFPNLNEPTTLEAIINGEVL